MFGKKKGPTLLACFLAFSRRGRLAYPRRVAGSTSREPGKRKRAGAGGIRGRRPFPSAFADAFRNPVRRSRRPGRYPLALYAVAPTRRRRPRCKR